MKDESPKPGGHMAAQEGKDMSHYLHVRRAPRRVVELLIEHCRDLSPIQEIFIWPVRLRLEPCRYLPALVPFCRTRACARQLLLASIVYLPLLYGLLVFDRPSFWFRDLAGSLMPGCSPASRPGYQVIFGRVEAQTANWIPWN